MPTTVTNTYYHVDSSIQYLTLPYNIIGDITVTINGAGGTSYETGYPGGAGGQLQGSFHFVRPAGTFGGKTFSEGQTLGGHTLYIFVGGNTPPPSPTGGYNGGGAGFDPANTIPGRPGGGASDIRLDTTDIGSWIAVAGGGGGAARFTAGGAGGGNTGNPGTRYSNGGTGGGGGSQTAGGAHGVTGGGSAGGDGYDGAPGQGGNGGYTSVANCANGGGGGGGYYGGGGGGAAGTAGPYGGSGGGGSSWVGSLDTVNINSRGGGAATDTSGSIVISYVVADPVIGTDTLNAVGGMSLKGSDTLTSKGAFTSSTSLNIAARPLRVGLSPIATLSSLQITRGPEQIFGPTNISVTAALSDTGFRSYSALLNMAATASMPIHQTSGAVSYLAQALLNVSGNRILFVAPTLLGQAALKIVSFDTIPSALQFLAGSKLQIAPTHIQSRLLTMAAAGSVLESGTLTEAGGIFISPRTFLTLSGWLIESHSVAIFTATGLLELRNPLQHSEQVTPTIVAGMVVGPDLIIIAAPFFQALGALEITNTSLTNVVTLMAFAQMIVDNTPQMIQIPYYLQAVDGTITMNFSVTSWPNPNNVRQVVTGSNVGTP